MYCRSRFSGLFNNDKEELDEAVSFLHLQGTVCMSITHTYITMRISYSKSVTIPSTMSVWCMMYVIDMPSGTLLHFDDHNLKDLYFLDPQWLAKLMADVIHPHGPSAVIDGMLYYAI